MAISSLSQLQCTLLWSCTRLGILSIAQIDGLHCAFITGANGIIKPIRWKQETLRAQHNIRRMSRDEVAKAASQGCPGKVRSKSFSISYRHRCHGISLAAGRHAMEYCFCNEPRSKWKCQNLENSKRSCAGLAMLCKSRLTRIWEWHMIYISKKISKKIKYRYTYIYIQIHIYIFIYI